MKYLLNASIGSPPTPRDALAILSTFLRYTYAGILSHWLSYIVYMSVPNISPNYYNLEQSRGQLGWEGTNLPRYTFRRAWRCSTIHFKFRPLSYQINCYSLCIMSITKLFRPSNCNLELKLLVDIWTQSTTCSIRYKRYQPGILQGTRLSTIL